MPFWGENALVYPRRLGERREGHGLYRLFLPPFQGHFISRSYPGLVPPATFLRRFAALR
jgi:hypothetical protein